MGSRLVINTRKTTWIYGANQLAEAGGRIDIRVAWVRTEIIRLSDAGVNIKLDEEVAWSNQSNFAPPAPDDSKADITFQIESWNRTTSKLKKAYEDPGLGTGMICIRGREM